MMPIKGLTTSGDAAFPKIGNLRKGAPAGNNRPGKDLEHFRFDTTDPKAQQDFDEAYGKEPRTINVYLPFEKPDENFQAWQEEYTGGGLVHRCDGETMYIWQVDGKYQTGSKPCPYHTGEKERTAREGCKPVGRLSVIIPELQRFAYVTVGTTSINDIMQISENLAAAYALKGTLQGIPFILCRRPKEISTPGKDGKRTRRLSWLISIEPNPEWVRVQLQGMQRQALAAPTALLVDSDTGEILDDADDLDFTIEDVDEIDPDPGYAGPGSGGWVEQCLMMHRQSDKACSDQQYQYLAGILDKLTDGNHGIVFDVLTGRETSAENRVGLDLARYLFDSLVEYRKVDGQDVASATYDPQVVDWVRQVYDVETGQVSLFGGE